MLFLFRTFLFFLSFSINFGLVFSALWALEAYTDILGSVPIAFDNIEIAAISFIFIFIPFLYDISPVNWFFLHLSYPVRKLSAREKDRLQPLLDDLFKKYKSTKLANVRKVKLHMFDDPDANAFAFGKNKIALATGLLDQIKDDDVIKSIMAHELGHLHYRDTWSEHVILAWGSFFYWVFAIVKYPVLLIGILLSFIPFGFIIGLPLIFAVEGFSWLLRMKELPIKLLLNLNIFMSRAKEYRADKFAFDLVGSKALLKFFEDLRIGESRIKSGFLIMQRQSHPPTELRIDRLFSYERKKDTTDTKPSDETQNPQTIDISSVKGPINFNSLRL